MAQATNQKRRRGSARSRAQRAVPEHCTAPREEHASACARLGGDRSLRPDLSIARAADIIWSMNAPEFDLLLVEERGWSPEEFEGWLAGAWIQLLLEP